MRRTILFGLCFAAALGLSATGFLVNQRIGAQDTPQKAEPEKKKDDLFDVLKGVFESKKDVPAPPPTLPSAQPTQEPTPAPPLTPVIPPPTLPQAKDDKVVTPPPPTAPPVVDAPKPSAFEPVVQPKEPEKGATFPPPVIEPKPSAPVVQPKEADKPALTIPASESGLDPKTGKAITPPQPAGQLIIPKSLHQDSGTPQTLPPSASAVVKQEITDQLKRARDLYQENKLDAAEVIVNHVLRLDDENLAARSLKMHIQTRRNQELFDPDPKPRDPRSSPEPLSPVQPTQPIVQQVAKMKDCPWSLQVEMIDGQTVVTATVHKKHMFHITCQTLDLQTGKRELKASGKVQIGGDMMSGSCDHLAISLTDDRLVLEGAAEVTIQKLSTNVSETKPASFELKGQRLDLRISELPSIRPMPAGLRQVGDVTPAYLPTLPSKSVSMQTNARPAESGRKWTPYGTLRRVESKVYLAGEGEMVWSLDDARGVSLVMIVARDGGTLMQYEGQRISALGSPEMIKGATFLRVTHIALP